MKTNKVSIKSDKSILVREIYRLKRELVAETHRADDNLRLLKVCLDKDHATPDPDPEEPILWAGNQRL